MHTAVAPTLRPRVALFGSAALLAAGAVLAALDVGAIGWSLYVLGFIGLVASFSAIAIPRRSGRAGPALAAILVAGGVLALPRLLMVWAIHSENGFVHDLFMPYVASPFVTGGAAGAWVAIAVLAVLTRHRTGLGTPGAFLVIAAAIVLVPFELRLVPQVFWVLGSVLLLLAVAASGGTGGPNPGDARGALRPFGQALD